MTAAAVAVVVTAEGAAITTTTSTITSNLYRCTFVIGIIIWWIYTEKLPIRNAQLFAAKSRKLMIHHISFSFAHSLAFFFIHLFSLIFSVCFYGDSLLHWKCLWNEEIINSNRMKILYIDCTHTHTTHPITWNFEIYWYFWNLSAPELCNILFQIFWYV